MQQQVAGYVRRYIFGEPTSTLEFDYSETELAEIHAGQLPERIARDIGSRGAKMMSRAARVALIELLVGFALIGLIVLSADQGRLAVTLFLGGLFLFFAGGLVGQVWWRHLRTAKNRSLKMQTRPAFKATDEFKVTFGLQKWWGKSWSLDKTAYSLIEDGATYNVYSAADMLVYLE